jgi:molybdate transport system substrate-binding protein
MSTGLSSSVAFLLLSISLVVSLDAQKVEPTALTVAAAADLSAAEPVLAAAFEKANPGLQIKFVTGASTALAQQIRAGAPFDIFLSANIDLVDQLHLDSPKTYTVGHVALLWKDGKSHPLADLSLPAVRFVALPNPKLAPYGLAAQRLLERAGLWEKVQPKIVYAENVRQTLQLFDSGNADAVLTALALLVNRHPQIVPSEVIQKGGIVPATKHAEAAQAFLNWLMSPPAQQILARFGFDKPGA